MSVLVTGGAGYVDSIVTETLIKGGHDVIVLDNLQQGHRDAIHPKARFIVGDIGDAGLLEAVFRRNRIDAVMHMAAETVVEYSMTDPKRYFHNNIIGGINLLDTMLKYHTYRIIFSSSASVYGEPQQVPITEDHVKNPVNSYGETKYMFEKTLQWYARAYGLKYSAFRYFNAAGASDSRGEDHQPETHLIPNILKAALLQTRPIEIYGTDYPTKDGTCVRDYVHVLDIAKAHVLGLEKIDKLDNRAYNLGNGSGYSVMQVIAAVARVTGAKLFFKIKTRRKEQELQQELNMAGRLASIGEVAAGIAHEINNPLTGVIGFAQMLSSMNVPQEMREAVEVIQDGAKRTASVVEKLLAFARRSKTNREMLDVNMVVKSTADIRAYELRNNNIELNTSLDPNLPLTTENFGQLQQVVLNLIINAEQAIGAAKRPGKLSVKSEMSGGKIRVSVTDNGIGIPKENLSKLFDPFFTTKTESGGTGLGLSISYGIIKEHNGKIKVKSKPDEGTCFIIEIPVVSVKPERKAGKVAIPVRQKAGPARIIVVDDEINICRVLNRILTREGHEVDTVLSAEAALERMQDHTYDLILLDMRMPGMSGIDLYNRMEAMDPQFKEKVVFITGDIITPKYRAFIEDTGVNFVTKPFTSDSLMRQVYSTLGGQKHE